MEIYEIETSIGSGSFGQVYLALHKREQKKYVIKKIKTTEMSDKDRENTEQEVRLLQNLRQTNIVAFKDSYLDREHYLNIVMEYCEGGDLYQRIKANKGKAFHELQIMEWFVQMCLALYYLHDKKILHRDLKTQNIFLRNGRVKLGDFGIAKVLDSTQQFTSTCIGTPYYMSPELFKYKPYSYKSDIWALGCVLYELCNLKHAFDAESLNGLALKIMKGNYASLQQKSFSSQLKDLVQKMLNTNPKQRPNILDILNKAFVRQYTVNYLGEVFGKGEPEDDDNALDALREQTYKLNIVDLVKNYVLSKYKDNNRLNQLIVTPLCPEPQPSQPVRHKQLKELKKVVQEKKAIKQHIDNLQEKISEGQQVAPKYKRRKLENIKDVSDTPSLHPNGSNYKLAQQQDSTKQKKKFIIKTKNEVQDNRKDEEEEVHKAMRKASYESDRSNPELKYQSQQPSHQQQPMSQQYFSNPSPSQPQKYQRQYSHRQEQRKQETIQEKKKERNFKMMEDYDMHQTESESEEVIEEEEEENEQESLNNTSRYSKQLTTLQNKLKEKTQRLNELRQTLQMSPEEDIPELSDTDDNILMHRAAVPPNPMHEKVQQRIRLLQHRCETGLGNIIFHKAFQYVQMNSHSVKQAQQRRDLIDIMGEDNIGFWHLMDQILLFQGVINNL